MNKRENKKIIERINLLYSLTEELLNSSSILYSEWKPRDCREELKNRSGIYHFFQKKQDQMNSLYIGKAGFGANQKWDLYERIKQHFQPSQKNNFISKYAKLKQLPDNNSAKSNLMRKNIYVQWLPLYEKNGNSNIIKLLPNIPTENSEKNIIWIEKFCISILQPHFSDE